ncbi:MAG: hypothetical protein JXR37_18080 [Kiritimatiellae bacterium]|nr:hypothetical protein [Kiritimatiellia bacterium]
MKRTIPLLLALCLATSALARAPREDVVVSDLSLRGEIEGENIVFTLRFTADVNARRASLPLVAGEVSCLAADLPHRAKLELDGNRYVLRFGARRKQAVEFKFASRAEKDGDWRRTVFTIPMASVRHVAVLCDRPDLDVRFPGALNVERAATPGGQTEATAFLGVGNAFAVRWKPEVRELDAELLVACDVNMIATASVGALRLDSVYTFRVVQGVMNDLALALPPNVNVTQVRGADIQDWRIADGVLSVVLSRAKDDAYRLQVESETVLPKFPCQIELPVTAPQGVLRTSGFLMIGSDSAIKLLVARSAGLTQVEAATFPDVRLAGKTGASRARPTRSAFVYQYAAMPYTLALDADDITPQYSTEDHLTLSLKDNDLVLHASAELDVRDAPCREIVLETDPDWLVANVSGRQVSDYDIRAENGKRAVYVYFREGVIGRTLVDVRLEKALGADETAFTVPGFSVRGAKAERGYLVLAAEQGVRLRSRDEAGLRDVNTGATPLKVPGAQLAFRFKEPGWQAAVSVQRIAASVHCEVFHLISLGESVLYGSSSVTYHVAGAPVRAFKIIIPADLGNVEFVGRDIRNWEKDGEVWTVALQEKVLGDYTLTVTYDRQFAYDAANLTLGGVHTLETDSEEGFVVLASSASLVVEEQAADPSVMRIDRNEVPEAYVLLVNDPVLASYRYVRPPHQVTLKVSRFQTEQLLLQVVDHASLATRMGRDGEAVTAVRYFVKNASKQYLTVRLPARSKLWSTKVADEGGRLTTVSSKRSGDDVLIPLGRPRNPNMPLQVELVYAEAHGEPGVFGRRLALEAPVTPATHMAFAEWQLNIPEGFTAAGLGGTMSVASALGGYQGLAGTFHALGRLCMLVLRAANGGWLLFAAVCVAGGCVLLFRHGARRSMPVAVVLVLVAVLAALFVVASVESVLPLAARLPKTEAGVWGVRTPRVVSLSKAVDLADGVPPSVRLWLVPDWIGRAGSPRALLVAGILALLFLAGTAVTRRRRAIALAFGFTLLAIAVSQVQAGQRVLAAAMAIAVPAAVVRRLLVFSYRTGLKRRDVPGAGGADDLAPFVPAGEDDGGPPGSTAGHTTAGLLALVLACSLCVVCGMGKTVPAPAKAEPAGQAEREEPAAACVMDRVTMEIAGPAAQKDKEKSARVRMQIGFEAEQAGSFTLLGAPAVVMEYELNSRHLSLRNEAGGYRLHVARAGRYEASFTYLLPVTETRGQHVLRWQIPRNLQNTLTLTLPETGLAVDSPDAVFLKSTEGSGATVVTASFGVGTHPHILWRPRERRTGLEETVFFVEVNTLARFEPGVVDVVNKVRYQIAQGEVKAMSLTVPEGMSVTAVAAPGLSTWRFDPQTRLLEAILEKPASTDFVLSVATQVSREGLPYAAEIGVPQVSDARRQRGALALACPDSVQIHVEPCRGASPMNVADFPADEPAPRGTGRPGGLAAVKRAFRYHQLPVAAQVKAEAVLSELRVVEKASLSLSDERVILSSQLEVDIAKSGVFTLRLDVPAGYDVESVTGKDISHWDEVTQDEHSVLVHFARQVLGAQAINLVLTRTEKGIGETVTVPRVAVGGARKHAGTLIVSGERGVRMTTVGKEGVSEVNPRELGVRQAGSLAFRLLRPNWQITLKTEVMAPVLKPEVLQRVDLSEGRLQGRVVVRYKIENAGCKRFVLRAPQPGISLSVTGRDIAKAYEIDAATGVWEVDLHNKTENAYELNVAYQIPFDAAAGMVTIRPLLTVGTEAQKGYVVVMSGGRMEVKPRGAPAGLQPYDSRSLVGLSGVEDLSGAILCYRAVQPQYELEVSVLRHASAEVLPANVKDVSLTSVVADGGQMLTHIELQLDVGNLRFLEVGLPGRDDTLWSAFVNGKVATVSRADGVYRIPLDAAAEARTMVDLVYAGTAADAASAFEFRGPTFNLPLTNIRWTFHMPPGRSYYGFNGTMKFRKAADVEQAFDAARYNAWNNLASRSNLQKAKSGLAQGEQYAREGKQLLARKALEAAVNWSEGQTDFNEDARVQYRNLIQEQAVVGLVNRRGAVRLFGNVQDEQDARQLEGFQGGNYTPEYAAQLQQRLSASDNDSLRQVADKIINQQAAAAAVAQAIQVTVPEHGRRLEFVRNLLISPRADLAVTFKCADGRLSRWLVSLLPGVGLFFALWFVSRRALRGAGVAQG